MKKAYQVGILGCGDYVRLVAEDLKKSKKVSLKSWFDLNPARAKGWSEAIGGQVVNSADEILNDPAIDIVGAFVPPFARRQIIEKAVACGKHILTPKPLGSATEDCVAMLNAVEKSGLYCGVLYRRNRTESGDVFETLKEVLVSGEIGRLMLFREDWLHHYPQWNTWAVDPVKNGGPFQDAMIHNMNLCRYLMGRPAIRCQLHSSNLSHAGVLKCADTEWMKLDFMGGGYGLLFITWAADLQVMSMEMNEREHHDVFYLVTDQGWHVTLDQSEGKKQIVASREGKKKSWEARSLSQSMFDRFASAIEQQLPIPTDICTIREAYEDIRLIRDAEAASGRDIDVQVTAR